MERRRRARECRETSVRCDHELRIRRVLVVTLIARPETQACSIYRAETRETRQGARRRRCRWTRWSEVGRASFEFSAVPEIREPICEMSRVSRIERPRFSRAFLSRVAT